MDANNTNTTGAEGAAAGGAVTQDVDNQGAAGSAGVAATGGGQATSDAGTGTGAADKQAAGAASGTILGDAKKDAGDDKNKVPADWPADWRQKGLVAAGFPADDKKVLGMLERLGSPGDLVKKLVEQEKLISQGKQKQGLAKDATTEQAAAWRKENGIPESAEKYDLTLPDGLVIGETDKPIIDGIAKAAHEANMTDAQLKGVVSAYYAQQKEFLRERDEQIAVDKQRQEDVLRADWGNDFRVNVNAISALTQTYSQETRNALAGALDSKGMPLLNNQHFLRDMAIMARTINPIDTVTSGGGSNQMSSVDDEIKAIEARMGGVDPTYYKDEKAQARYRELVDWRDRNKKSA